MASINAPMQIRYYTTERAVNRRGRKGRREVQTKEILKVFPGGPGIFGGENGQAAPWRCEKVAGRCCIRLGPRLRTRSRRIRSSKSAGAYMFRARKTSACDA